MLDVVDSELGTILLHPERPVTNGARVFVEKACEEMEALHDEISCDAVLLAGGRICLARRRSGAELRAIGAAGATAYKDHLGANGDGGSVRAAGGNVPVFSRRAVFL